MRCCRTLLPQEHLTHVRTFRLIDQEMETNGTEFTQSGSKQAARQNKSTLLLHVLL